MEAVGAAASILAIAGAGLQISLKLIAFADQVGTAAKRIQDVGTDVSVTAGTLQELGELMEKSTPTRKSRGMFHPDQVEKIEASSGRCKEIFDDLKAVLSKASQQLRDVYKSNAKSQQGSVKIKLSRLERLKWPFLDPSIQGLQRGLRDAKSTLMLLLQIVNLRYAHMTPSLDRDEQRDLIRMIATMGRQQSASPPGDEGGYKGLDVDDTEDSDSGNSSKVRTVLEAWSVTPNTLSRNAFQHVLITPIPVSEQKIAELVRTSPQNLSEIASMIDSLSTLERGAILGEILDTRHPGDSTIRLISSQVWTGSHDLFGKVNARKFKVIVERRLRLSKISRNDMNSHDRPRMERPVFDSFSDSDDVHEAGGYIYTSSPSPPSRKHAKKRPPTAPDIPSTPAPGTPSSERHWSRPCSFERRRPRKSESRQEQEIEERNRLEEENIRKHRYYDDSSDDQTWTETECARGLSDDDLVKRLLAEYTNFEPGEPLVQSIVTPPPSYDESFVIPKRVPRPY